MTAPVTVVRVMRNLRDRPFAWRATGTEPAEVRAALAPALRALGRPRVVRGRAAIRTRLLFGLPPRPPEGPEPEFWRLDARTRPGAGHLVALVNAVDHLVIQLAMPGVDLRRTLARTLAAAAAVERRVPFARAHPWGWLTASPADTGCGARALVLLPAGGLVRAGLAADARAILDRAGLAAIPVPSQRRDRETWQITHRRPLGLHPLHILLPGATALARICAFEAAASLAPRPPAAGPRRFLCARSRNAP